MKIALVETQNPVEYRTHRTEYFPFIAGLAEELGWAWRWLAIRVPADHMHLQGRFVVDLPEERLERLVQEIAAEAPEVIVTNDRPALHLMRAFEEAAPGVRIVDLSKYEVPGGGDEGVRPDELPESCDGRSEPGIRHMTMGYMARLLAGSEVAPGDDAPASEQLVDAVWPRYGRLYPWPGDAEGKRSPAVRVFAPTLCQHRRPVRRNRFYRDLDALGVEQHVGCAFCFRATMDKELPWRLPPAEMALRQMEAHQRDEPARRPGRFEYIFDGDTLYQVFEALMLGLLGRDLQPSKIIGMMRVDQFLRLRPELEELLPRLEAAGHCLELVSMGAENFSAEENERFNKGIRIEQLDEAHGLFVELEERFPKTFRRFDAGTFTGILFTPWTQPKDLLANIEAARRLGAVWLESVVGSRLQLRPGLPITALARRDGLTAEALGSTADVEAVCLSGPDEREIPWRFANPITERIHQLLIRLEPIPAQVQIEPDDPLFLAIREGRARLPEAIRRDYVGLAEAVVRTVDALGPDAAVEEVFGRIAHESLLADGLYQREKGLDEHGAALMVQLLTELAPPAEPHLSGYRFVEATPVPHGGAYWTHIALQRDGRELRFDVAGRSSGNEYWLAEDRFAVVFEDGHNPKPDELAVAGKVLRLAEEAFPRRDQS